MANPRPVVHITRRAEFSASHRYYDPKLSQEENEKLFGSGARPYGHGHNYAVELSVRGEVDPHTGIVVHTRHLKESIENILKEWDHRNLNELPEFSQAIPTLENIARILWHKLALNSVGKMGLERIRVYEEPELFVDYGGE